MKASQVAVAGFKMPLGKNGKPKSEHIEFFDGKPGFGLRIRRGPDGSEHRTYIYQYKSGELHYRMTLGNAANLSFGAAKEAYESHLGDRAKGKNPAQDRRLQLQQEQEARLQEKIRKAEKTLKGHISDYLVWKERRSKPRSYAEIKRILEGDYWAPLHDLPLRQITRGMVSSRVMEIERKKGSYSARLARVALSTFFKWALEAQLCEANPVIGSTRADPDSIEERERVLSDAELAAIWKAAPDSDYGRIVKLLMLTAQRRDEIGGLRWSELDADAKLITLPAERLKNGRSKRVKEHTVPLTGAALAVLDGVTPRAKRDLVFGEGENGFSGWSAAKRAIDEASGVKDWRLHDLRRTGSTRMADCGVAPHIIEMVLNHISGFRSGVAGVYNRATYEKEKKDALDTLASYIKTAVAAGGNVRRLQPRRAG